VLPDKWVFLTTAGLRILLEVVGSRREDFPLVKLDGPSLPAGVMIPLQHQLGGLAPSLALSWVAFHARTTRAHARSVFLDALCVPLLSASTIFVCFMARALLSASWSARRQVAPSIAACLFPSQHVARQSGTRTPQ
jgi:hypothetical protein